MKKKKKVSRLLALALTFFMAFSNALPAASVYATEISNEDGQSPENQNNQPGPLADAADNENGKGSEPTTDVTEPTTNVTEPATNVTEPATGTTEPTTGTTEPATNVTEPATGTTEPAINVTEPATGTTEPATNVTEPATGTTEPTTNVTEPATNVTEPATGTTEPTTNVTGPATGVMKPAAGVMGPAADMTELTGEPQKAAANGPDLIITEITWTPENPKEGDQVSFSATIKNQGNAASNNVKHGVRFYIDNRTIGEACGDGDFFWSNQFVGSLASGETKTVSVNGFNSPNNTITGTTWKATEGKYTVTAYVDDSTDNDTGDSDRTNNFLTVELNVAAATTDTGYKTVTVTGIQQTKDWDTTVSENQNYFVVPDVQLDPDGNFTIKSNGNGINISNIEINGVSKTVKELNEGNAVIVVEGQIENGVQIASLEKEGAYAEISNLKQMFGLTENKSYTIRLTYAIKSESNKPNLTITSSVGTGEKTVAYADISHGNPANSGETGGDAKDWEIDPIGRNPYYYTDWTEKGTVFFDTREEPYSFNTTKYWDLYNENLEKQGRSLRLQSSTDANVNGNGALVIDFETGANGHYTPYQASGGFVSEDYTDGSYTVTGWGGNWAGNRDTLHLIFDFDFDEANGENTLDYFSIHLYNGGTELAADACGGKPASQVLTKRSDGKYELDLTDFDKLGEVEAGDQKGTVKWLFQGLKFAFDQGAPNHRSGTLTVKSVKAEMSPEGGGTTVNATWDFSMFHEMTEDGKVTNPMTDPKNESLRPLLRTKPAENDKAGSNLANKDTWMMWDMSTSDANIVSDHNPYISVNDTGFNALEIKYRNDGIHETYTWLTGDVDYHGEWLIFDMADQNWHSGTKIVLVNNNPKDDEEGEKVISLGDFKLSMDDAAGSADARTLAYGVTTLYYRLDGFTFDSVRFDFSGIQTTPGEVNRMFVKDIILLGSDLGLEKTQKISADNAAFNVDGYTKDTIDSAKNGDYVDYRIQVKNIGQDGSKIEKYTVEDIISVSFGTVVKTEPTAETEEVTLEGGEKATKIIWAAESKNIETTTDNEYLYVRIKISDTFSGIYTNIAHATRMNNSTTFSSYSNRVTTKLIGAAPDSYVFYAEVNQNTYLPVNLGMSSGITEGEQTSVTKIDTYTFEFSGNDQQASSENNVTIPEGATVTLTGPDSAFVFSNKAVEFVGSKSWDIDKDNKDNTYTVNGELGFCNYTDTDSYDGNTGSVNGNCWGFQSGAVVTLKNVPQFSGIVKINTHKVWNCKPMTMTVTYTTTETGEDIETAANNTYIGWTQKADQQWSSTVTKPADSDPTNFSLEYMSTKPGKQEFIISYYPGGDVTKEARQIPVTVYNYQVKDHVYVLDYGLPVNLTGTGSGSNDLLKDATLKIDGDDTGYAVSGISETKRNTNGVADSGDYATPYGASSVTSLKNGTAKSEFDASSRSTKIEFTPNKFMSDVDTFYYGVQVTKEYEKDWTTAKTATPVMEGEIKVMPASVVYYEDSFASSGTDDADGRNGIIYQGSYEKAGTEDKLYQSNDQDEQYGYDNEYKLNLGDSSGSSTLLKATKSADDIYETKAIFQFKGTGFDVVGRSTHESTIVTYKIREITRDENGVVTKTTLKKAGLVDTYYANGDLYQIPVIHEETGAYGEYQIELVVCQSAKGSTFYLDGIRIYNPLGASGNSDYIDNEEGASIVRLRDLILGDGKITESGIVIRDDEYGDYQLVEDYKISGSKAALLKSVFDDDGRLINGKFDAIVCNIVEVVGKGLGEAIETDSLVEYLHAGPEHEVYLPSNGAIGMIVENESQSETNRTLQVEVKLADYSPSDTKPEKPSLQLQALGNDGDVVSCGTVSGDTAMYIRIPVEKTIDMGNGKHLVILYGASVDEGGICLSYSNVKYNGYKLSNPLDFLENDTVKGHISKPEKSQNVPMLIELKSATGTVRKGQEATFYVYVSSELAQRNPVFGATANGNKLSTRPIYEDSQEGARYKLKIKAPQAMGTFPIVISCEYDIQGGDRVTEYLSTSLRVIR